MLGHYFPLFLSLCVTSAKNSDELYASCDEDSVFDSKPATALTPNTFHKICPPVYPETQPLGQPICGDGSAFSFFYTSPVQRLANKNKIIIEFMGGGACWDADTCNEQSSYLTFPENLNEFIGYSCSEAEYGMNDNANLLCTSKFGNVDLTEYNTIIVPYCSQDVHMGDSYTEYDGGGTYHHGAHNLMSVLNWVYENYPNPSHIALSGCSAGGTVLPLAYDLLTKHYNALFTGGRTVNVNVLVDSPVYLTPEYFLNYGFPNWNPNTILEKISFNYSKWKFDVQYSTKIWDHVLNRGFSKDKWGFVSHVNDEVSIRFWQAMSGNYDGADGDDGDDQNTWYSDLMESLNDIMAKHDNVDTFFMDSDGHCTFGLYYALDEDGFEEWAEGILKEQNLIMRIASSFPMFLLSIFVGLGFIFAAIEARKKPSDTKTDSLLKQDVSASQQIRHAIAPLISFAGKFQACPITTGYLVATSFYFLCLIISGGFANPLNNPSLGPNAITLSMFGINNPTLIVNKKHGYRLLTSTFLCSGALTYVMVLYSIFKCTRHLERVLDNIQVFTAASVIIMLSSNFIYALFGEGASCSSVAFILGLNSFSIGMHSMHSKNYPDLEFPSPWFLTIVQAIFACVIFPFNNYVVILSAMITGVLILPRVFKVESVSGESGKYSICAINAVLLGIGAILGVILILLLAGVPSPDEKYESPYLTGCEMKYSLELKDIADQFLGGGERRLKEDENFDDLCGQFCVPHLIEKPFSWSIEKYTGFSLLDGSCSDVGYGTHVADKTYEYWGYSFDVEMYFKTEYE